MMPDTSVADYFAIGGAFLAAFVTHLGLRRGDKDKTSLPAPNDAMAAGVFMGLDAQTEREILIELKALRADQMAWRKEDVEARHMAHVQDLENKLSRLQQGQVRTHVAQDTTLSRLAELLRRLDDDEETGRLRRDKSD